MTNELEDQEGSGCGIMDVISGHCPGCNEKTREERQYSQSLNADLNLEHTDYVSGVPTFSTQ